MAFVPAPGIVALAGIMRLAGERCENTFHYAVPGTIDQTVLHNMISTYITWWTAHANLYSNACGLELVYARDLTTQASATLEEVPATVLDGSRTSPLLPNSATIAVKRQTGLAGRRNRGRVYWVGITEDMKSSTNELIQTTANAFATALSALGAAELSANSALEVILHRATGAGQPVIGYTLSDYIIDNQRRRLPGHNRHH